MHGLASSHVTTEEMRESLLFFAMENPAGPILYLAVASGVFNLVYYLGMKSRYIIDRRH